MSRAEADAILTVTITVDIDALREQRIALSDAIATATGANVDRLDDLARLIDHVLDIRGNWRGAVALQRADLI